MIFKSKSVLETYIIADKILTKIKPGSVIALLGDLGTGKTTFTQGFAKALKIEERVGSPTFKLVSEYECNPYKLYHIDVYRLKNSSEFLNINQVWNLVLSCKECNRGSLGKFDKIPEVSFVEDLNKRNNHLS